MKKVTALLAVIAILLAIVCLGADTQKYNSPQAAEDTQNDAKQEEVQGETKFESEEEELVLSFAGDIMFDKSVAGYVKAEGQRPCIWKSGNFNQRKRGARHREGV